MGYICNAMDWNKYLKMNAQNKAKTLAIGKRGIGRFLCGGSYHERLESRIVRSWQSLSVSRS
jgi:hypothetical protein